jgi:16S rRNA (guanine527-N7)-methyltransferase
MAAANFERLREEAARLGITLEPGQLDRFRSYLDLLLGWNRKINLTAITDPEQVLDKHFLDSLAAAPHIPAGRLIDVGAGAGLPGIPIAIVRPDVQVSLLESTGKKAAFLRTAIHQLGLSSSVLETRLEQYRGPKFDAAISRATFAPAEWLARARSLVEPGGSIFLMMGREEAPAGASSLHEYSLPGAEARAIGHYRT